MKKNHILMTEWDLLDSIYEEAKQTNPSHAWDEFHTQLQAIDLARANKARHRGSRIHLPLATVEPTC